MGLLFDFILFLSKGCGLVLGCSEWFIPPFAFLGVGGIGVWVALVVGCSLFQRAFSIFVDLHVFFL